MQVLQRNLVRASILGVCGLATLAPMPFALSQSIANEAIADKATVDKAAPTTAPSTKPATTPTTLPATAPATLPATAPSTLPATAPSTLPATARAVDPIVAAKVAKLLKSLGHEDWRERKRSADELERLGEPAEPALHDALKRKDLSVDARTAIEVLLNHAAERRRIGATLVTLSLQQAEPSSAFVAIAQQGGLKLSNDAVELLKGFKKKIDVQLDREPLFSALNKVGVQAGVGFTGLSDNEVSLALREAEGKPSASPAAADGPFMLTIQRVEVTLRKVVEFAGPRGGANPMANAFVSPPIRISVAAWAEPRVKPGSWMLEGVSEIKTDNGKTLAAQVYGYSRNTKTNDGSTTYITVSGDTEGASAIESMTVKARLVLQWNTEAFEVDNVQEANELSKTVAGNRVVLKQMRKMAGELWSYEVILYRDNRSPEEWTVLQQTIDRTGCRVLDAAGKPLQQRGSGSSWSQNEIRINGTISQVNGVGPPKKLIWDLPGKIETLPGNFVFKNLPLP